MDHPPRGCGIDHTAGGHSRSTIPRIEGISFNFFPFLFFFFSIFVKFSMSCENSDSRNSGKVCTKVYQIRNYSPCYVYERRDEMKSRVSILGTWICAIRIYGEKWSN